MNSPIAGVQKLTTVQIYLAALAGLRNRGLLSLLWVHQTLDVQGLLGNLADL